MTWVLDCDGVVWLADEPIPGAPEAVARLRAAGQRVVFLTNNSVPRLADHLAKLRSMGMPTGDEDLISSPMAAASLLEPGERALVLGGPGVLEALSARGVEIVEPEDPADGAGGGIGGIGGAGGAGGGVGGIGAGGGGVGGSVGGDSSGGIGGPSSASGQKRAGSGEASAPGHGSDGSFAAVVVGFDLKFNFARLAAATTALRAGARLIATNDDATFPTAYGLLPGAGSFVAAVAKAGGAEPVIGGKPHQPVADLLCARVGAVDMVVGDRPSTDGRFARLVGARFGLVLTGVTPAGHGPLDPAPDLEATDLIGLVEAALAR